MNDGCPRCQLTAARASITARPRVWVQVINKPSGTTQTFGQSGQE